MDYDVTSVLANVRRRGSIPDTATTGTQDTDLLAHLNSVLQLQLAAKVISAREGFYRKNYDYSVSSTNRYRIPARALGNRLAAVLLLDSAGNTLRKLDEIPYGRLSSYQTGTDAAGYILEADEVVLVPSSPNSTVVTVRLVYYVCPNEVTTSVDAANASAIAVSSVAGSVVTLAFAHNWTTSTKLDVIRGGPPFAHMQVSVTPTAVGATTVTLSSVTGIAAGDYVCAAELTKYPQIPDAFFPLLEHLTAMEVLKALGDRENHKRLAEELPKLESEALTVISPRVEEGSRKIMSNAGALGVVGRYRRPRVL